MIIYCSDSVISTFILTPPVNLSILEFTNVSIPCIPNEMLTVTWTTTGAPATNNTDESINIINIDRSNTGIYICIASNGDTAAVNVTVLCKLLTDNSNNIYIKLYIHSCSRVY